MTETEPMTAVEDDSIVFLHSPTATDICEACLTLARREAEKIPKENVAQMLGTMAYLITQLSAVDDAVSFTRSDVCDLLQRLLANAGLQLNVEVNLGTPHP